MKRSLGSPPRCLADFSIAAKLVVTLFLLVVGSGYLVAVYKIYVWYHDADGEPAMTVDDIRAVYHGMEKQVTETVRETLKAPMLKMVEPGGKMRKHLDDGGEPAIRALMTWLEEGAPESTFATAGIPQPLDPSPKDIIARHCVECHHANGGDKEDVPYAPGPDAEPQYVLVIKEAASPLGPEEPRSGVVQINPISVRELIHITHAHTLSIPVFSLIVAGFFLWTRLPEWFKLIVAPLPMLAICIDFACWWLSRPWEPAIYGIAAAGAIFGIGYGVQIICVFCSMWLGRKTAPGVES